MVNRDEGGSESGVLTAEANQYRKAFARCRESWRLQRLTFAPAYRHHFRAVLGDTRLTANDRNLYTFLYVNASKNGEVRLKVSEIAAGVCLKERATQNALAHLEEMGLIRRLQFSRTAPVNYFLVAPDQYLSQEHHAADPDAT